MRLHLGPLTLTPAFGISRIGIDTNVFNESERPERDFTATFDSSLGVTLPVGRGKLGGRSGLSYVYFDEHATERSFNTDQQARVEWPMGGATVFATARYVDSRSRPNVEIDARARRFERGGGFGTDLPLGGATRLAVEARRDATRFREGERYRGSSLDEALDRTVDVAHGELRFALTPLTTLVLGADVVRERFAHAPVKDADSLRVAPGFDFRPFAVLEGRLRVGYRAFRPRDPALADFTGLIADIDLAYVVHATRLALTLARDVSYSFQTDQPYFVHTNVTASITQKITDSWALTGRAGLQRLAYRQLAGIARPTGDDDAYQVGGGLSYRLVNGLQVGINADRYSRRSADPARPYEGVLVGGFATYGY